MTNCLLKHSTSEQILNALYIKETIKNGILTATIVSNTSLIKSDSSFYIVTLPNGTTREMVAFKDSIAHDHFVTEMRGPI